MMDVLDLLFMPQYLVVVYVHVNNYSLVLHTNDSPFTTQYLVALSNDYKVKFQKAEKEL